jgi:F-type H+-transporting ATPase subunit b
MKNKYIYCGLVFLSINNKLLAKSTLPQLDVSTYSQQIFWFFVTFIITYIFISKIAIPKISNIKAARYHNILTKLEQTIKIKKDLDAIESSINLSIKNNIDALNKINKELEDKVSQLENQQKNNLADFKAKAQEDFNKKLSQQKSNLSIINEENVLDLAKSLAKKMNLKLSNDVLLNVIKNNMGTNK